MNVSVYFSECIYAGNWHANNVYFLEHIKNVSSFKYVWVSFCLLINLSCKNDINIRLHQYNYIMVTLMIMCSETIPQWVLIRQKILYLEFGLLYDPENEVIWASRLLKHISNWCPKANSMTKSIHHFDQQPLYLRFEVFILARQFSGLLTLYCVWRPQALRSGLITPEWHIQVNLQKATDPEAHSLKWTSGLVSPRDQPLQKVFLQRRC